MDQREKTVPVFGTIHPHPAPTGQPKSKVTEVSGIVSAQPCASHLSISDFPDPLQFIYAHARRHRYSIDRGDIWKEQQSNSGK
jgi:hypothetical protein